MSLLTFKTQSEGVVALYPWLYLKSSARFLLSVILTQNIENIASTMSDFVPDTNIDIWEFEKY